MTGLQRRDVDRLIEQATSPELEDNVVTRVVGQWVSDRRFSDKRGRPRALRLEGKNSDFAKLVRLISKDLNHYSVLFELERLGLVVRKPDLVRLLAPDHQTKNDFERGFAILSKDASDLIVSVVENLKAENSPPNLHARTEYDNVSEAALPEIRRWFIALGQKVHAEARDFLSKFDRDINPKLREQGPGARVSLGTFSRVEPAVRARKNRSKGRGES